EFDPAHWFLLCEAETPRAVLLLGGLPRTDSAELVYLGVVPEARGRGLGDLLMRRALATTAAMRLGRLTLAADVANPPALALHYRHGFKRAGGKIAMMRE